MVEGELKEGERRFIEESHTRIAKIMPSRYLILQHKFNLKSCKIFAHLHQIP